MKDKLVSFLKNYWYLLAFILFIIIFFYPTAIENKQAGGVDRLAGSAKLAQVSEFEKAQVKKHYGILLFFLVSQIIIRVPQLPHLL